MIARLTGALLVVVALGALAPSALAVLEVRPNRVAVDSDVDFVLRVHSVRAGTPTQAVRVRFPDEVAGAAIGAPPLGWSMRPIESDGRTVGVRFLGGAIPEGTHQDFLIRARTVAAGRSLWTAEQYYENGEVVEFTLRPGEAGDQGEGAGAVVEIVGPPPAPAESAPAPPAAATEQPPPASGQPFAVVPDDGSGDDFGLLRGFGVTLLVIALIMFVAVRVLLWTSSDDRVERPA